MLIISYLMGKCKNHFVNVFICITFVAYLTPFNNYYYQNLFIIESFLLRFRHLTFTF